MNLPEKLRVSRKLGCPSALELHFLAFEPAEGQPWRNHVAECADCRHEIERLVAERRRFVAEHPPDRFLESLPWERAGSGLLKRFELSKGGMKARTTRAPWLATAAAVAAAIIVVMILPQEEQPPLGIRLKGESVDWTVFVSRDGRPGNPLNGEARLHPGDILSFAVQSSKSGQVLIVNLDDQGRFSRYFPADANSSGEVAGGHRMQLLPTTVRLDDFIGKELIVLLLSEEPLALGRVEAKLADAFRQAGGRLDQMSLVGLSSLNVEVKWLIVTKEAR
jgi:hypothetical protein